MRRTSTESFGEECKRIIRESVANAMASTDRSLARISHRRFLVLYDGAGNALPNWRVTMMADGRFVYPDGSSAITEDW